jgi:hypothetical protein
MAKPVPNTEVWSDSNLTTEAAVVEAPRRTRIVLEDNDQIGPSGQFFGADGKGYMLRPGEEADVPDSILNILDTAVGSVPVTDSSQTVIGYRDRLRFPYRVIAPRRGAN